MKVLPYLFMFSELFCLSLPFDIPWWVIPTAMVLFLNVSFFVHLYSFLCFPLWFISGYFELTSSDPLILKAFFLAIFAARFSMLFYYRHTPIPDNWGRVWSEQQRRRYITIVSVIIIIAFTAVAVPDLIHLYAPSSPTSVTKAAQPTKKPTTTLSPNQQQKINKSISSLFGLPTSAPSKGPAPTSVTYDYPGDDYVANHLTKVYHLPWCELLEQLSETNREYFHATPVQMKAAGYRPCIACEDDIMRRAASFPSRSSDSLIPVTKYSYTANTSSKVFHKPSCVAIKQISINNCKQFICSRQEMLDMGYTPCQRCHP